jgi:hypothetical protein
MWGLGLCAGPASSGLSGPACSPLLWRVLFFAAGQMYALSSFGLRPDLERLDNGYGCEASGIFISNFYSTRQKSIPFFQMVVEFLLNNT